MKSNKNDTKELIHKTEKDLKISKIANGIPIGRSIDSYDELTFLKALEDRREIEY